MAKSANLYARIEPDLKELNIISFRRMDRDGNELVIVMNFAPVERKGFVVDGLGHPRYNEVFNSDGTEYGGSGITNPGALDTVETKRGRAMTIDLPGMAAVIFKPAPKVRKKN